MYDFLNEVRIQTTRIRFLIVLMILCYAVYLFFPESVIIYLNEENAPVEMGTAIFFFAGSLLLIRSFFYNKNLWLLLLGFLLFFGAGEELSWGQHLLHFRTPDVINSVNVQHEFNIHNIECFNTGNFNHTFKKGWSRILEINFLFRVFCITYGILIPLIVLIIPGLLEISKKIKFPVPPLSIGIFFSINWFLYRFVLHILPQGHDKRYYAYVNEAMEFMSSAVFLMICFHFYRVAKSFRQFKNNFSRVQFFITLKQRYHY